MQLFYVPDISENEAILDEQESRHAIKVLRLEKGSHIQLTDGKGGLYNAEITDPHLKKCRLAIRKFTSEYGKKDFRVHIAIAPTKNNDRLEWFLEKATEIGIDEISLIACDNSERKTVKTDRLEKILISAMKQSLKTYLPGLNKLINFDEFISRSYHSQNFIAHCHEGEKPHLKHQITKGSSVLILIGPEGDFSVREAELARQSEFVEVTLGGSRLRTETAGVVACHTVNLLNE
jgi:16S rRNA (uracil1498-N3)-methyltransferase